jgi:hypothetical protein
VSVFPKTLTVFNRLGLARMRERVSRGCESVKAKGTWQLKKKEERCEFILHIAYHERFLFLSRRARTRTNIFIRAGEGSVTVRKTRNLRKLL